MTTEPVVICRDRILECWRDAATLLLEGERANLIIHAERPDDFDEAVLRTYNPRRFSTGQQSARDVANTIFPASARFHGAPLDEFCAHYTEVYERGGKRAPHAWGTYFQRLISFGHGKKNQLKRAVDGLTQWQIRPRAAFVLHLSSAELDKPRPQGAPCWQYAQFIRNADTTLSLTAVYRSHDYFEKALGNFAGLRRLLLFVCHRAGLNLGTLTCVSAFATAGKKREHMIKMLAAT